VSAEELAELKAAIQRLEATVTAVVDALVATIDATFGEADRYPQVRKARAALDQVEL